MYPGQNAKAVPCCEVPPLSYVHVLGENIETLEKSISALEIRLEPVLTATGPQDACGQLAKISMDSRLVDLVHRLADLRHRVEEITRRVQA